MPTATEVWSAVDAQRVSADLSQEVWKRSYTGVQAALKYVGFELVTTREEFEVLEVPLKKGKWKSYAYRRVLVSREGFISKSTAINDLLCGNSKVLSEIERRANDTARGVRLSALQPKGIATGHLAESKAVDDLDVMLGLDKYFDRQHLYEFRLADVAYSLPDSDISAQVWFGDQIKSATAGSTGQCTFNSSGKMTVLNMLKYVKAGLGLTCIGLTPDGVVDVVWFFHGEDDIAWLSTLEPKQSFGPTLHLKTQTPNVFTKAINAEEHRFDVGKSADERKRLLVRKILAQRTGVKHTLEYLNEDPSQIPSEMHRRELEAFAMVRTACAKIDVIIERHHEDAYGPVDYRVATARIQDKTLARQANMRNAGRHPYNPDEIDILQVTDVDHQQVYALPMRVVRQNKIESFLSEEALMRRNLTCSPKWKEAHKQYLFDLKDVSGIKAYSKACEAASRVPKLTDESFFGNMVAKNQEKFGSRKQLAERKKSLATK